MKIGLSRKDDVIRLMFNVAIRICSLSWWKQGTAVLMFFVRLHKDTRQLIGRPDCHNVTVRRHHSTDHQWWK